MALWHHIAPPKVSKCIANAWQAAGNFLLVLLFASLGLSCSVARNVRPVGQNKFVAGASVGGPVFANLGPPIPVPLTTLFGRYGLDERTDFDWGLHLPIARVVGIDAGLSHLVLPQREIAPALMVGGRLALMGNGRAITCNIDPNTAKTFALSPRLFEEVYATTSWQVSAWLPYVGLSVFSQLEKGNFRPTLYGGTQWLLSRSITLSVEAKWMAFTSDQRHTAVNWRGIAGLGAIGVHIGAFYLFGTPAAQKTHEA